MFPWNTKIIVTEPHLQWFSVNFVCRFPREFSKSYFSKNSQKNYGNIIKRFLGGFSKFLSGNIKEHFLSEILYDFFLKSLEPGKSC